MNKPSIGLALGGGAARGLAHIGVLEALSEAGLEPQIVAGTSIGAIAGGFYAAGRLDELHCLARGLTLRQLLRYLDVNLSGSSLMTGKRLEKTIASHIGDLQIENLPKQFVAVATELGSGQEVWLTKGSLAAALRASYALPGILKPIRIGGRWLMDGALVNPVPVSAARALGAQFVIAVTFHQGQYVRNTLFPVMAEAKFEDKTPAPKTRPRKAASRLSSASLSASAAMARREFRASCLRRSTSRRTASRAQGSPVTLPDATIQVSLDGIGLFDFHKAEQAIELGRAAVKRFLSGMRWEGGPLETGTAGAATEKPLSRH